MSLASPVASGSAASNRQAGADMDGSDLFYAPYNPALNIAMGYGGFGYPGLNVPYGAGLGVVPGVLPGAFAGGFAHPFLYRK